MSGGRKEGIISYCLLNEKASERREVPSLSTSIFTPFKRHLHDFHDGHGHLASQPIREDKMEKEEKSKPMKQTKEPKHIIIGKGAVIKLPLAVLPGEDNIMTP